jgi:DNA-binding LacI/PurR family transcriptional regulator
MDDFVPRTTGATGAPRRTSMADVALKAGVSGQTVSRVVNGSPRVDDATRARVRAAMAELGYVPHRAARALRTGRSGTIGVLVSTLESVGNSRMLQAVSQAAAARDLAVMVVTVTSVDALGPAVARLVAQGVDGVIVLNEASALARIADLPATRILAVDSPADPRFAVVHSDHAGGARRATDELIAHGRTDIRHLAGPAASFAAAEREKGWRGALTDAGLPAPPVVRGDWTSRSGAAARTALAGADAVFAANDQMALGLLRALHAEGRTIPDEVEIVGFDDVPDAEQFWPPLTTVRQDFDVLGERAVEILEAGDDASLGTVTVVPTTLIERATTRGAGG